MNTKKKNKLQTRLWIFLFLGLVGGYGITVQPLLAAPFVYVVSHVSQVEDGVSVIDTTTNTVVGNPIPLGNRAHAVAITPDGKHAYVATDGGVSMIDTTTKAVVGDPIPVGINWWEVGRTAWSSRPTARSLMWRLI